MCPIVARILISLAFVLFASTCLVADPITLAAGSTLTLQSSGTYQSSLGQSVTGSATTVFQLSSDGLTLEMRFTNTSAPAVPLQRSPQLTDLYFNVYPSMAGKNMSLSLPVGKQWFIAATGPNEVLLGILRNVFSGNGLLPNESGLAVFSLGTPVTSLSIDLFNLPMTVFILDTDGVPEPTRLETRIVSQVVTPPSVAIPEPASLILLAIGLAISGRRLYRRRLG